MVLTTAAVSIGALATGCGAFSLGGNGNQINPPAQTMTDVNAKPGVSTPPASVGAPSASGVGGVSSEVSGSGMGSAAQTGGAALSSPKQPTYPSLGYGATGPDVVALNERLAELGYLPVEVTGTAPDISLSNLDSPPTAQFSWRYENVPADLQAQWNPSKFTQMTRGAVIAVEHQNGLAVDGVAGPQVWQTILASDAKPDADAYTYVLVSKAPAPERLRVWQAGRWVYSADCNTGVKQAPTEDGTFAVYLRFLSQTMSGTNPDGTHYRDPGVPYVNYFNGSDAIHGFERSQYGYPQSVGCVELPVSAAKTVWSLLDYGTLVTVVGTYSSASGGSGAGTTGSAGAAGVAPSSQSSGTGSSAGGSSGVNGSGSSGTGSGTGNGGTSGITAAAGGNTSGTGNVSGNSLGMGNTAHGDTTNGNATNRTHSSNSTTNG